MDHFVSCDWGSSSFRLRLVDSEQVCEEVVSNQGATELIKGRSEEPEAADPSYAFRSYLRDMLVQLQSKAELDPGDFPIVVSGMATSAHGWKELPYARAPVSVDGQNLVFDADEFDDASGISHPLFFISGVRTDADVMRGEECEILGLLHLPETQQFQFGARVLMPGTHSKHIIIRNGMLEGFETYMTGELFQVLGHHSVLNHTIERVEKGMMKRAPFMEGVQTAKEKGLSAGLFTVRTNGLFGEYCKRENAAFLSGLLIGAELKHVVGRSGDLPIVLCAGSSLLKPYREALREIGEQDVTCVSAEVVDTLSAVGHRVFLQSQGII